VREGAVLCIVFNLASFFINLQLRMAYQWKSAISKILTQEKYHSTEKFSLKLFSSAHIQT